MDPPPLVSADHRTSQKVVVEGINEINSGTTVISYYSAYIVGPSLRSTIYMSLTLLGMHNINLINHVL